jgi:hypothetical protein
MRPALFAFPFALLLAAPALADMKADQAGSDQTAVVPNADGSFTITATIEPEAEALDALPWEANKIDGSGEASRRPRDEADEAIDEAFEEVEDMARMEAGPD